MTSIKGERGVFQHSRLLLGSYPDRPAPVHVVNGFLCAALGEGEAAEALRRILRDAGFELPNPPVGDGLRRDQGKSTKLRQALRVVLDPDRRVFPTQGSAFPLHGGFVSRDSSDDGFGEAMWDVVSSRAAAEFGEKLRELLFPKANFDALSGLAILLSDVKTGEKRESKTGGRKRSAPWPTDSGELGKRLTTGLTALVVGSVDDSGGRSRSTRLLALTQGLYFGVFLAALRGPTLERQRPKKWEEVGPAFVFGGVPPGDPREPAVRLAQRSYETLVEEHKGSLRELLVDRLKSVRVPSRIPARQQAKVRVRLAFDNLSQRDLGGLEEAVGGASRLEAVAKRVLDAVYPTGHLERGFRSMGRKIGIAGPDRGFGAPRLLLETPMLGVLVDATVAQGERVPYDDWLDRVFDRFGLILGRGRSDRGREKLKTLESAGPLHRAVEQNQEMLRRRLLRTGLAVEYSDAETEVHRHEET